MKRFAIIVVILAVIAGSAWVIYSRTSSAALNAAATTTASGVTAVTKGDIDLVVAATGSLVPERQVTLLFAAGGVVSEVIAVKGARIEANQVLAKLDTSDLELSIRQSEISLASAEASFARTTKGPTEEDIAASKSTVATAQANLDDLYAGATEIEIQQAQNAIDQAKNSLWGAQASRDSISGKPVVDPGAKAQAEASVANAEIAVQNAQLNYDKLMNGTKYSTIQSARNQLVQAQNSLAKLLASPSKEDIAIAQAQVDQAKLSLQVVRNKLDDMVLKATVSGTLAEWNIHSGDTVAPSTIAGVVIDDSKYHIVVSIDETEIGKLAVGQTATVVLDAFSTTTLTGSVSVVSLIGTTLQGIVYYNVRIDLDKTDLPIRPSLTASVSIIAQRKENVLLVPSRAIKRDTQGAYVTIQTPGGSQRADVKIGISNGTLTEVTEGLAEGDRVYLTTPAATTTSPSGFGFPGMGGANRGG
ncbi:MAG: efflux RND transporter periplasmic adaptor subunit [Anaerolineae bacterium]